MADGKQTDGVALQRPPEHWPKLVGALFDDLTKIIEGEIRLFSASLETTVTNALARSLRQLVSVVLGLYAAICLIGATILLLHNWFVWWKSLGIAGIAVLLGAVLTAAISRYIDGHREPN